MKRIAEPELMDDPAQVQAYTQADFEQPHSHFMTLLQESFPAPLATDPSTRTYALDLGCGPADISRRYARAYPDHVVHAVDGAANMLKMAQQLNQAEGLNAHIELLHGRINDICLPRPNYDVIFSNSLLHHLQEPLELWRLLARHVRPGTRLFVMDLLRPESTQSARHLLDLYAADESEILRQDFFHSLCAAYSVTEVQQQLADSHIDYCHVKQVSDRHLIVYGTTP